MRQPMSQAPWCLNDEGIDLKNTILAGQSAPPWSAASTSSSLDPTTLAACTAIFYDLISRPCIVVLQIPLPEANWIT